MKGLFITFEGPDGAGKSSVIERLMAHFNKMSQPLSLTREPGGIVISEKIRQIILDPENTAMDERTEALLYAAARRQHLVEKVWPKLDAGEILFCDRFVDSSLAYQGAARGIGVQAVAELNEFATQGFQPDLTLYLDVPAEVGLNRIQKNRQEDIDRLDQEKLPFHEKVRAAYLELMQQYPERIILIDATQSLDEVVAKAIQVLELSYPNIFLNE